MALFDPSKTAAPSAQLYDASGKAIPSGVPKRGRGRPRGGAKVGGRKKGTPNKYCLPIVLRVAEVLDQEQANPAQFLARVMKDEKVEMALRIMAAGRLLEFTHPKLKAIEHKVISPVAQAGKTEVTYRWIDPDSEVIDAAVEPAPPERQIEMKLQ